MSTRGYLGLIHGIAGVLIAAMFVISSGQSGWIWALAEIFLMLLVGLSTFLLIGRPLELMTAFISQTTQGQLNTTVEITTHNAEIQVFLNNFEKLLCDFKKTKALSTGILAGLPTPFLLVDAQERTIATNAACMDMVELDCTPEAQLGRTLAEIFYNDPSRQTAVGKSIREGQIFRNLEVTITGHKGGKCHVLANVFPLYDQEGSCIGGMCIYLDMTTIKDKEEHIKAQNEMILSAAGRAADVSDQLSTASKNLNTQVGRARAAVDNQSQGTSDVAMSMDQMNAAILDVARGAASAATLAENANTKAHEGQEAVREAQGSMRMVASQTETLKTDMASLGKEAESIGAVTSVISDIADQTNLLALNAAIEAARAGDAGRGFAVVADEVRKLAEKTMVATKEVSTAVAGIRRSVEKGVNGTDSAVTAVEKSVLRMDFSEKLLTEIVKLTGEAAASVSSIAAAAEEQSASSETVAARIMEIRHNGEQSAAAMGQASEAVEGLVVMTRELDQIVVELKG